MSTPKGVHFYTPSELLTDVTQFLCYEYTNTGLCRWIGFTDLKQLDFTKSKKR